MKYLDKFIRRWRVNAALKYSPEVMDNVFDIGCDDGYLLRKVSRTTRRQDGVDPRLKIDTVCSNSEMIKGYFPSVIQEYQMQGQYDAVFALAVFEHFTENDLQQSASVISRMLSPKGRLIITVPHPFVDKILDVLIFLHLIEAETFEEHHGFEPEELLNIFSGTFKLLKRERFQLGLNNVFVFERF